MGRPLVWAVSHRAQGDGKTLPLSFRVGSADGIPAYGKGRRMKQDGDAPPNRMNPRSMGVCLNYDCLNFNRITRGGVSLNFLYLPGQGPRNTENFL